VFVVAGLARVAGVADAFFLGAGFLTDFDAGAAGASSTITGFGRSCVGLPVIEMGSIFSVSGW